ncbi:Zn(II)2Cys6 transcription factor [Kocuria palustris]|nr:Zn(II)2Cys6 transcription factor [Kocuria palustris]
MMTQYQPREYPMPEPPRPHPPVARRACLLCREKKIKCDGEPVLTVTSCNGLNKVVPQRTRVCSNCQFLGHECVFVQLNRGGRRRKRSPDAATPTKRQALSLHPDLVHVLVTQPHIGAGAPPTQPPPAPAAAPPPGSPPPIVGYTKPVLVPSLLPAAPPYLPSMKPGYYHATFTPAPVLLVPLAPLIVSDQLYLGLEVADSRYCPTRGSSVSEQPKLGQPLTSTIATTIAAAALPISHPPLVSPYDTNAVDDQPWTDRELAKYDLPRWSQMDVVLKLFYKHIHPNHMVLPDRQLFVRRLALNVDAAVLHSIILNVCLIQDPMFPTVGIKADECYWFSLVDKHWESLNYLLVLLCSTLLCKSTYVRYNLPKLNFYNKLMWGIIDRNKCMEIFNLENYVKLEHVTKRQVYERELLLRLVWLFYINNLVLLRLSRGFPYDRLGNILDDEELKRFELTKLYNQLIVPLSISEFWESQSVLTRHDPRIKELAHVSENCCMVLCARVLENVLDGIVKDNLVDDESTQLDPDIQHLIDTKYMVINHEERLLCFNLFMFNNKLILLAAALLKFLYFMHDIMLFKLFKQDFIKQDGTDTTTNNASGGTSQFLPLVADVLVTNMCNFEEYPKIISNFTVDQWRNFVKLIIAAFDFSQLMDPYVAAGQVASNESYDITFGPTVIDDSKYAKWYQNPKLRLKSSAGWSRYGDAALEVLGINLIVLALLAVLTKYIQILPEPSGALKVHLVATNETKTIPEVQAPLCLVDDAKLDNIESKIRLHQDFIKSRIRSSLGPLYLNTLAKLDRIKNYLDEILQSIRTEPGTAGLSGTNP